MEKTTGHAVKIIRDFSTSLASLIDAAKGSVDMRDFFVFGGLAMLGYGLWLLRPWIGFSVPGAILLCIGLFVGERKKT